MRTIRLTPYLGTVVGCAGSCHGGCMPTASHQRLVRSSRCRLTFGPGDWAETHRPPTPRSRRRSLRRERISVADQAGARQGCACAAYDDLLEDVDGGERD